MPAASLPDNGKRANSQADPPLRMNPSVTMKRPVKKRSTDQSISPQS
jgi:hypothetical protein